MCFLRPRQTRHISDNAILPYRARQKGPAHRRTRRSSSRVHRPVYDEQPAHGPHASLIIHRESSMYPVTFAGSPAVTRRKFFRLAVAVATALAAGATYAQQSVSDHVPPPQDSPYVGTVAIHVDANDTAQGIFRVHETIPVKAGALT